MDFTRPVSNGFYSVVVPLRLNSNIWFFVDPYTWQLWILCITIIPLYIIAFGLMDCLYFGSVNWNEISDFVIRNALSEQNFEIPCRTKTYQRLLVIIWLWSSMILVSSYAGNLTAMLSKPKLQVPISSSEELISQNKISWVIEEGDLPEFYFSRAKRGSKFKKIYENAKVISPLLPSERKKYGCFSEEIMNQSGLFASICGMENFLTLISNDYSKTGKCNYYLTQDRFISFGAGLAFPVKTSLFIPNS